MPNLTNMGKPTRPPGFHQSTSQPLQIFQDEIFDTTAPMTSHAPMPSVSKIRRPLTNSNTNSPVVLNPPSFPGTNCSPYKGKSSPPRAPLKPSQGNKLNVVPMARPAGKGPVTDSLQKKQPQPPPFRVESPMHAADASMKLGKENMCHILPVPTTIDLSIENYYYPHMLNAKQSPIESTPLRDSRSSKKSKADEQTIPNWDAFPPIVDDGAKPQNSYAQLIGMAILRSPQRRLTLSQIYKWISDHYSFYAPTDAGWQNSIRHNLSLHKSFIKIERSKDDPGKGNYWGIEPGNEHLFLKEKPIRKSLPTAENMPVMSARIEPSQSAQIILQEPTLPPLVSAHQHHSSLPPLPTSQATVSMPLEPSSDATIVVPPDNPPTDEPAPKEFDNEPHNNGSLLESPLPATIHSSPPPPLSRHNYEDDTPLMGRNSSSSKSRSHKRKFASMDDSGYISSLESSVLRPSQKALLLTSEGDRPRIKRGRAEEEIARLRGSSPFSPTKARSFPYGPVSSSPLRQIHDNSSLRPLTPMVKMKPPMQPPPSVSPNTNLRNHRDKVRKMLQSPLRRVAGMGGEESIPWSPAFHLDETLYNFEDFSNSPSEFDVFQDFPDVGENVFGGSGSGIGSVRSGSPIKRSMRRNLLDQVTSTPELGDVSHAALNRSLTSAPSLKVVNESPSQLLDTPSKIIENFDTPSKMLEESPCKAPSSSSSSNKMPLLELPGNDWQRLMSAADFAADDNADYSGGLDILQGFQKIGARGNKAGLARSYSTTF